MSQRDVIQMRSACKRLSDRRIPMVSDIGPLTCGFAGVVAGSCGLDGDGTCIGNG